MTPRREVLDFIQKFTDEHDYAPSVRDICAEFDMGLNAVNGHLKALPARHGSRRRTRQSTPEDGSRR